MKTLKFLMLVLLLALFNCSCSGSRTTSRIKIHTNHRESRPTSYNNTSVIEYVFFDHDKSSLNSSELNAVYKIYTVLNDNKSKNVNISGWASYTSGSYEYNLRLSERRCETVRSKLIAMGIDQYNISISPKGKDSNFKSYSIHEMGRRLQLTIN